MNISDIVKIESDHFFEIRTMAEHTKRVTVF